MEQHRRAGGVIGMVIALIITAILSWLLWVIAIGDIQRTAQGAVLVYNQNQTGGKDGNTYG